MPREYSHETLYYKVYKEDFKLGGILYDLDPSASNTLMRLESYTDKNGKIQCPNGKGYKTNQLQSMVNLEYRALKRALLILRNKGFITVNSDDVITVKDYHYNNDLRFKYKNPYPAQNTRQILGIKESGSEKND
jgi:hypothetical protein